ncbi:hypothetical protein [Rathayibacter tanaceti]|uniref:Uncharacterized protein n=2 Tax=Rathayibacter tanaceti TaxID=1671680 RepID=A0A166HUD3_9MICO|nr:hypothetical protein [Rathayibacter tanaceti]KZX21166.1 hypothetical protein ACH61_01713 [Rathayibacter tanaceti]QHC54248.1 hypothetical protein GSU10_00305 [Rathayibacter tanaceti]TCO37925.1 hypothetical protein EV639_103112 [Rathayibacter tanaceti]
MFNLVASLLAIVSVIICVVHVSRISDVDVGWGWIIWSAGIMFSLGVVRFAWELTLRTPDEDADE